MFKIFVCTLLLVILPHPLESFIYKIAKIKRFFNVMNISIDSSKVGVIIVDHGSRKEEANNMLLQISKTYEDFSKFTIVEAAHMELAEPSISAAFTRCVQRGATRIVCHPFFLSKGRHVTEDIPALLEEAAKLNNGVPYTITKPLGLHENILALIDSTITESL